MPRVGIVMFLCVVNVTCIKEVCVCVCMCMCAGVTGRQEDMSV